MKKKLHERFEISTNVFILCVLTLVLGFLIIISLIICIALDAIDVQGVKELLGILGGALISPSVIIFLRKVFLQADKKVERKSKKKQ